jgi:hypothetical protein
MKTPTDVSEIYLECTCENIRINKWDKLMEGATRANHKTINRLVKEHLPDLYNSLALEYYNPYNYFKTKTHLILVHSSIEYFL